MLKSGLIASVCALGLLVAPVMAATSHHKATHASTGTAHGTHSAQSGGRSSQDSMADQLNGQSLQAAMQGRPFSAGGGSAQPAPTPRP